MLDALVLVKELQDQKTAVYKKKGLIAPKDTRRLSWAIIIPVSNQPRKPEFHLLFPNVLVIWLPEYFLQHQKRKVKRENSLNNLSWAADLCSQNKILWPANTISHTDLEADNRISCGGDASPSFALLPGGLQQYCAAAGLLPPWCTNGLRLLLAPRRNHRPLWLTELHTSLNLQMLWKALKNIYRNLLQLTERVRVGGKPSSSWSHGHCR